MNPAVDRENEVVTRCRLLLTEALKHRAVGINLVLDHAFCSSKLVVVVPLDTGLPNDVGALHPRPFEVGSRRFTYVAEHLRGEFGVGIVADRLWDHGNAGEVLAVLDKSERLLLSEVLGQDQLCARIGILESLENRAGRLIEEGGQALYKLFGEFVLDEGHIDDHRQRGLGPRQQIPIPVVDVTTRCRSCDHADEIALGLSGVALRLGHLNRPQPEAEAAQHHSHHEPDTCEPPCPDHVAHVRS